MARPLSDPAWGRLREDEPLTGLRALRLQRGRRLRALRADADRHLDVRPDGITERHLLALGAERDAAALLASYGSSDEAFLDVVFGDAQPEGSLPFDLPRSMAAVMASRSDVPFDTADPVFRFGHGLRYS